MQSIFQKIFAISTLLLFGKMGFSQIIISGPTCVVPSTIYQYVVSGLDSSSSAQICITSGSIVDSPANCAQFPLGNIKVLVIWNDSASDAGTLNFSSSAGNASLSVYFTPLLTPGSIDSASKAQLINYNAIPAVIICGPDSGGSCTPSFIYQWQQSADRVTWVEVQSGQGVNLTINSALTQSTYYRRNVTEVNSGTIGYSDEASVFVIVPQSDSTLHTDSVSTGFVDTLVFHSVDTDIQLTNCTNDNSLPRLPIWVRRWNKISKQIQRI